MKIHHFGCSYGWGIRYLGSVAWTVGWERSLNPGARPRSRLIKEEFSTLGKGNWWRSLSFGYGATFGRSQTIWRQYHENSSS